MKLNEIPAVPGNQQSRNRVGRGPGSGNGKTAGRGHKGQKARSGGFHKSGFEGGQMPLQRRLPKRGFKNFTRKEYTIVQVEDLEKFFDAGSEVNAEALNDLGLLGKKQKSGIKLLANGDITKAITVYVDKASAAAVAKMEAAGGKVVLAVVADPEGDA
ncbi:LSU ribosomal protein L15P [Magnetococcus marinus MC-1]|uniref:Large ribosomal subunit protein uL15 n=1 Tax=Magnetococcus marinus (strain ATCC BAA-1437 / JCM 17883 / MC-1) TaxID=156889 RepID=RL15_MAGMM|nr:50S ribosomal protein L15 [Magnetococcus marinus]A0L5Z2.1 RecName: Full=Large ribosomal subunit protein uL15; AltName: Full=50S ribosomal protein L15 [Magnetococcus marinus MC-1]ABK43385.1 LSU ribosomal protein L15P [Magnetococcus marinus MC-1]